MAVDSIANTGLQSMLISQQQMARSANDIAQVDTRPPTEVERSVARAAEPAESTSQNKLEPLLQMKAEQLVFDANAKVASTEDETLGALLDTRA